MKQRLSLQAIWALFTLVVQSSKLTMLLIATITFVTALVTGILAVPLHMHHMVFGALSLVTGVYTATRMGSLSHRPTLSHIWYGIPVSALEKLVTTLLFSLLFFPGIALCYTLSSALIRGIALLLTGELMPLFSPFSLQMLPYALIYLLIQPIFLFSAITLKEHAILTGVAVIVAAVSVIVLLFGITLRTDTIFTFLEQLIQGLLSPNTQPVIIALGTAAPWIIGLWATTLSVVPILLWISIYYTFIERENLVRES